MNPPRSKALSWLPFVVIPLAVLLMRMAYYAQRSVVVRQLTDLGVPLVEIGAVRALEAAVSAMGYVLGAALVSMRPYAAALVGALVCALGIGLYTFSPGAWRTAELTLRLGMSCFSLGALFVMVASSTGFSQRLVAVAAVLGAVSLGGFLGPLLGSATYASVKGSGALSPAVLALVGVTICGALDKMPQGNESGEAPAGGFGQGARWRLSLVLVLVAAFCAGLTAVSVNSPYRAPYDPWIGVGVFGAPPLVGALGLMLIGALVPESSWSRARGFGVGLVLLSAAALLTAHGTHHALNFSMALGLGLGGFAQPIVESLLLAVLFGVWSKRRAGVVYLGFLWLTWTTAGRVFSSTSDSVDGMASLVWWGTVLGASGLLLGVAVLALSRRLDLLLVASDVDARLPATQPEAGEGADSSTD